MKKSEIPPPALLGKAVPLWPSDFSSGEVGRLLTDLSGMEGFRDMSADTLKQVLSTGLGYASWEAMEGMDKGVMAPKEDLPTSKVALLDVIGWRMYLTGRVGLREACVAIYGAWESNLLALRKLYGDFGILEDDLRERPQDMERREVGVPFIDWVGWSDVALTDDGRLRIRYAAEAAYEAAQLCWTPECGVTLEELGLEISRGSVLEIESALEQAWMFHCVWPVGLRPVMLADRQGQLVGYTWYWQELGLYRSAVFDSTSSFKASATALWRRQPTEHLATEKLPESLMEVDFVGPWESRDFDRIQSPAMKRSIAFEQRNMDPTPWFELRPTDGRRLQLGRECEIDGEVWTGVHRGRYGLQVEGLLGLTLPSMAELEGSDWAIEWIREKVPFALEQRDYEAMCTLVKASSDLANAERDWVNSGEDAERALSDVLRKSAQGAASGISAQSARAMEDPLGTVKGLDVPLAGEEAAVVYPELAGMRKDVLGEYALGFYGKNGIRHDRKQCTRDSMFMLYCLGRTLGVPVEGSYREDYIAIARLIRLVDAQGLWDDDAGRKKVAEQARRIYSAFEWANELLVELDASEKESRLAMVLT
jgi:hypothetical protein